MKHHTGVGDQGSPNSRHDLSLLPFHGHIRSISELTWRGGPEAEGRGGRGRESRPEGRGGGEGLRKSGTAGEGRPSEPEPDLQLLAIIAFSSSARLGNGYSFGIEGGRGTRRGARLAAARAPNQTPSRSNLIW